MDAAKGEQRGTERESFILKQTYFSVNNDIQWHGNIFSRTRGKRDE
jgi:hypothetical protein